MLALVLRGVVLIGVVGWYSTGVWKMIDGYFKDRFDKYLREEYAKNPRIKPDFKAPKASEAVVNNEIIIAVTESNKLSTEARDIDSCPLDRAKAPHVTETDHSNNDNDDKLIEINKNIEGEKSNHVNRGQTILKRPKDSSTAGRLKRQSVGRVESLGKGKKEKEKMKTIKLTEEDSKSASSLRRVEDYDFSEFEFDEGTSRPEGIAVDQLPFKPKSDIGKLETVTEDEFCPLSLDSEEDCDETKKWP